MSSKEKMAKLIQGYEQKLRCPLCQQSVRVVEFSKLVCQNNHAFDLAKQGYVNLLNQPSDSQYDKKLFNSRREIITQTNLYQLLHHKISEVIADHLAGRSNQILLDAGCGEGSHLGKVMEGEKERFNAGIGIDISKEGVKMAAGKYKDQMWFVADLANLPLNDQSVAVIMNILSPANYQEFKRVLQDDGLVVKVVPRAGYLAELREALGKKNEQAYDNEKITSLFREHFYVVDEISITDRVELSSEERAHLTKMAPLAWHAEQEKIDHFIEDTSDKITVDLDVLVGRRKDR
ncbi:methyltransferase domain-containing protein [Allobacillus sp. SKP2-8]|uniref:putative RNA methyltransferase n=1 Tax=unclassified Allobacillus TaxID=2628859 RepID=UPI0011836FDC|nr:methyltransferase domain-containing protein [Allobacillus sp. SKP2-8]TSJ65013.1 methyltransferase domain-containing protein [Allobacillus sp. SKP2-8]